MGGSEGLISWQADVVLPAGDPGYSARRRLTGFPLPGTRGYPSSHYKCGWIPAMLSALLMLNGKAHGCRQRAAYGACAAPRRHA